MNVPATVVDRATSAPAQPGGLSASPTLASATPASSVANASPDVQLIDVTKRFGAVVAVDRMNLEIPSGSFTSLLGPSGCGKTTTLRMIAGFEQPNAGEILLAGRPIAGVPPYRRNVNTVFQHYALFPHMDVNQNVGYGLRQKHVAKADEVARVGQALELVRLGGYGKRRTWELSGGQQQRVALARALINRPAVLLLDEPLGALDRKLRHEMQIELKAIQHEVGITFIYVTHDQEEALTMSDMIVVMRDGLIQQLGSPEMLYRRPANRFVAGFIGSSNFIPGTAREVSDGDRVLVGLADGVTLAGRLTEGDRPVVDSSITLALRPESVRLGPPRVEGVATRPGWTSVRGRVRSHTYLGDQHEYRVDVPGIGELIARSQAFDVDGGGRAFRPGEDVEVSWHETSALVLTS